MSVPSSFHMIYVKKRYLASQDATYQEITLQRKHPNQSGRYIMSTTDGKVWKTMVILAIEHTLLKIGRNTMEKVEAELYQEFKCGIPDCYEHPEYLSKVLKDLFGDSYQEVTSDVNRFLDDFTYQRPIAEFLDRIK